MSDTASEAGSEKELDLSNVSSCTPAWRPERDVLLSAIHCHVGFASNLFDELFKEMLI